MNEAERKQIEAEDRIQTHCYTWFHNSSPLLRGLLCYNHNNPKNAIDGAKQRGLGLQKGRSDLVFYYGGTAIMIEMKTPEIPAVGNQKRIPAGKQSEDQKKWQKQVESQGLDYVLCYSLEQFQQIIKDRIEPKININSLFLMYNLYIRKRLTKFVRN